MIKIKKMTPEKAEQIKKEAEESNAEAPQPQGDPKAKDQAEDTEKAATEQAYVPSRPGVSTPVGFVPVEYWEDVCRKCNIGYHCEEGQLPTWFDFYIKSDGLEHRIYRTLLDADESKRKGGPRVLKHMVESAVFKQHMDDFQGDDRFIYFLRNKFPTTRTKAIEKIRAEMGKEPMTRREIEKKQRVGVVGITKAQADKLFPPMSSND